MNWNDPETALITGDSTVIPIFPSSSDIIIAFYKNGIV